MSEKNRLVTITDRAAAKLLEIMVRENMPASTVRLSLARTHCMGGRGYLNRLAFEEAPAESDEVSEWNGVTVCVDPASAKYLVGAEIDYLETLETAGFSVTNPNVLAKCPCGHHDLFE